MIIRTASMLTIGLLVLSACKKEAPKDPGLTVQPVGSASGPAHAGSQPAAHAGSHPAHAGSQPAGPGGEPIHIKVTLASGMPADAVRATDTLYIMARMSMNGQAGGLVATKRITPVTLPHELTIGPDDVMMKGTPFAGPFIVHARLDRDGDPMTKTADDLYAMYQSPATPGQKNVTLELNKGTPEQAPGGMPQMQQPPPGPSPHGAPASQPSR